MHKHLITIAYRPDKDLLTHISDVAYDACDEDVTKVRYECTSCGAEVKPCGYSLDSRIEPFFKIKDKHKPNCNFEPPIPNKLVLGE